jgi:hypothetical protein
MYKFSKTTGCFYPDDIQYDNLPNDLIAVTDAEYSAAMSRVAGSTLDVINGKLVILPAPLPTTAEIMAQTVKAFEVAIQAELDADAQAKGYDNILSACAYAGAPNPFQTEAKAFITRRGNVWAYCYGELAKVQAGTREMPTIAQIVSELPARVSAV